MGDGSTGATGFPGNTISIGNSAATSVLTMGQNSTNRRILAWIYNAATGNAYMHLGASTSANALVLQNAGGSIGIGTSAPSQRFEVAGNVFVGSQATRATVEVQAPLRLRPALI